MLKILNTVRNFIKRLDFVKSKSVKTVSAILSIVCIAVILFRLVFACIYNKNVTNKFNELSNKDDKLSGYYLPYSENKSLYQFQLESTKYGTQTLHPSFFKKGKSIVKLKLTHDISLYNGPSTFETPIITLKKGTEIQLDTKNMTLSDFPSSIPTYEHGWRFTSIADYVTRNIESDHMRDWLRADKEFDFYKLRNKSYNAVSIVYPLRCQAYVKTDELNNVWKDFEKQYPDLAERSHEQDNKKNPLYIADDILKDNGIYLSPDLLKPIWDFYDTALLFISAICFFSIFTQIKRVKEVCCNAQEN